MRDTNYLVTHPEEPKTVPHFEQFATRLDVLANDTKSAAFRVAAVADRFLGVTISQEKLKDAALAQSPGLVAVLNNTADEWKEALNHLFKQIERLETLV